MNHDLHRPARHPTRAFRALRRHTAGVRGITLAGILVALLAGTTIGRSAEATTVYRCGAGASASYSQWPCDAATHSALRVDDNRTRAQRRDAQAQSRRERRLMRQMAADQRRWVRLHPPMAAASLSPVSPVLPVSHPSRAAEGRKAPRPHSPEPGKAATPASWKTERLRRPAHFTALVPRDKR